MAGRPTGVVPPVPPANPNNEAVGLPGGLPDPDGSAPFAELSPPADEASDGIATAGVELVDLLPDFFGF